jgi:hypothetical protein
VPKATSAKILNLFRYFLAGQRFPLHLAKDASGMIENCKAVNNLLNKAPGMLRTVICAVNPANAATHRLSLLTHF